MERAQKEYLPYLNEKLKAIQKELGRGRKKSEIDELQKEDRYRRHEQGSPREAIHELKSFLELMPPCPPNRRSAGNYLDWLLAVPLEEALQGNSRHQSRRKNYS